MSRDLDELYQSVILDHNKSPRNFHELPPPARHADGHNPLCGDRLTVWVDTDGDTVREVAFLGNGCAISKASASLMTDLVKGKTIPEAEALFERFHHMVTAPSDAPDEDLDKLTVLAGVRQFPMRVKCATLAWYALRAAVAAPDAVVSSE